MILEEVPPLKLKPVLSIDNLGHLLISSLTKHLCRDSPQEGGPIQSESLGSIDAEALQQAPQAPPRNTFSCKMLMPPAAAVTLLVISGLSGLEAVGPVVSNNQWTPVVNSRRVYLSPEVLAKYKQEEQEAQER